LEGELDDAELDDLDEAEAKVIKQQWVSGTLSWLKFSNHLTCFRQARSYRAFKALNRLIPNLLKTIDNGDSDELAMFYAQVLMLLYLLWFRLIPVPSFRKVQLVHVVKISHGSR
jgi:hypothetical protein